jgi:hypothetical protein
VVSSGHACTAHTLQQLTATCHCARCPRPWIWGPRSVGDGLLVLIGRITALRPSPNDSTIVLTNSRPSLSPGLCTTQNSYFRPSDLASPVPTARAGGSGRYGARLRPNLPCTESCPVETPGTSYFGYQQFEKVGGGAAPVVSQETHPAPGGGQH